VVYRCTLDVMNRTGLSHNVTLGLSRNQSVGELKVIRLFLIIQNGIILDLVCGLLS